MPSENLDRSNLVGVERVEDVERRLRVTTEPGLANTVDEDVCHASTHKSERRKRDDELTRDSSALHFD
jgi:hypothetical protein